MNIVSLANFILSVGTIVLQVCIIAALAYLTFFRNLYPVPLRRLERYGQAAAFWMAVVSLLGSAFYSGVAGFAPCDLCWAQRICMLAVAVLLALSMALKNRQFGYYGLAVAIVGFFIALYHNVIYYQIGGLQAFCGAGSGAISCLKRYVFEFGYITIPLMSLTAFTLIIILLAVANRQSVETTPNSA